MNAPHNQMRLPLCHGAALLLLAALLAIPTTGASSAAQELRSAILNGQIVATKRNGEFVPAELATVYILFSSGMERGSFSHVTDTDTAGGQYTHELNDILAKSKDLKDLEKNARKNPRPEAADQIASYYLQSVDEALSRLGSWLAKHPDRAWQMKTTTPNADGLWSVTGLNPGGYEIVVRGKFSGYDADWEAAVDLAPGRTISLPLTQPRFFRFQHE